MTWTLEATNCGDDNFMCVVSARYNKEADDDAIGVEEVDTLDCWRKIYKIEGFALIFQSHFPSFLQNLDSPAIFTELPSKFAARFFKDSIRRRFPPNSPLVLFVFSFCIIVFRSQQTPGPFSVRRSISLSVKLGELSSFSVDFFDKFDAVVISSCALSTKQSGEKPELPARCYTAWETTGGSIIRKSLEDYLKHLYALSSLLLLFLSLHRTEIRCQ
ncbi:hypothetical protein PHJA_001014500 [Phtheirospermum japonicum]|uniref:Uncharacterized protein n=1 Tax=Phtheirospermum japonicum TaxID=374723 RepID=A0A830BUS7_9LAMI|nr:hypothetical protein PHJA_001014500 [Phtheirospermum japonicum]